MSQEDILEKEKMEEEYNQRQFQGIENRIMEGKRIKDDRARLEKIVSPQRLKEMNEKIAEADTLRKEEFRLRDEEALIRNKAEISAKKVQMMMQEKEMKQRENDQRNKSKVEEEIRRIQKKNLEAKIYSDKEDL
jgi:hypothetical protein